MHRIQEANTKKVGISYQDIAPTFQEDLVPTLEEIRK